MKKPIKTRTTITMVLLCILINASAQQDKYTVLLNKAILTARNSEKSTLDTLLFLDFDWNQTTLKKHSYYRLLTINDSVVHITNFYRNGKILMDGFARLTGNTTSLATVKCNLGTCTWYDRKGRKTKMDLYQPFENSALMIEIVGDTLQIIEIMKPEVFLRAAYFKNGRVRMAGLFMDDCTKYDRWIYFNEEGLLDKIAYYEFGEVIKLEGFYTDGNLSFVYQFNHENEDSCCKSYNTSGKLVQTTLLEGKKTKIIRYEN